MLNISFKIFSHSSILGFAALCYYTVKTYFFGKLFLLVHRSDSSFDFGLPFDRAQDRPWPQPFGRFLRNPSNLVFPTKLWLWRLAALGLLCSFQAPDLSHAEETRFIKAREQMVAKDLMGRDIKDSKVLDAMRQVKRHLFVDKHLQKAAYSDHPLPIEEGQTISQPYIVALMTQILNMSQGEKVLEIGTGSGYQAAVLAKLTDKVFSIEIKKGLHEKAKERLINLGYNAIKLKYGDGYFGWEEHAPFDAIIITASANHIPSPLIKQLKTGGRLILPLGNTTLYQTLTLITKREKDLKVRHFSGVVFVPMTGKMQK